MSIHGRHFIRSLFVLSAGVAGLATVIGCSGSGTSASSPGTSTSTSAASSGSSTSAPASLQGKVLGVMPASAQSEYLQQEIGEIKETVQPLGWKVVEIDGQATPSDMETGISTFIADKVSAILTLSIGGDEIPQGLAAAKKAGIPVFGVITQVQPSEVANFAGEFADSNYATGQIVGEYACKNFSGYKFVGEEITANYAGQSFVQGVQAGLKACGRSYADLRNTALTGWPTDMGTTAQAELAQDSGNLLFIDYSDAGSQVILPVIQHAGRSNDVVMITRYNDASTIQLMRKGAKIDTVVTEGYQHIFDLVSALLAHWADGKPLPSQPSVTLGDAKVITSADLPSGNSNEVYPFSTDLAKQLAQWKAEYGV